MVMETIEAPVEAEWTDDNPYYLVIADQTDGVQIDLGERGWATTYAKWMRRPAIWFLMTKMDRQPVLSLIVNPGEQPYYTARHVGITGAGGSNEIIAYGIGKKRLDGHVDRLWLMPSGMVCTGDDVDELGVRFVKAAGPRR